MATDANILIDWIDGELQARGWTTRELARRAGLSHTTISNVMTGKRLPGWDFLVAIAAPLGSTSVEVFIMAGKLSHSEVFSGLSRLVPSGQADLAQQLTTIVQTLDRADRECLVRIAQALAQHR
jgi:transcriptional regulator with XRE-family HTH domain